MQVSDQQVVDAREQFEPACLEQSLAHTGAGVYEDLVVPGLDEDGGTIAFLRRPGSAGTEKGQVNLVFGDRRLCRYDQHERDDQ